MHSVAFFVSPHGFGHAARASAVMLELVQRAPEVRLEIFTRVPEWFFADTLRVPFGYHDLLTDIGMAQRTPLAEDLEETQRRLETFLPFSDDLLAEWAGGLHELGCRLVVCDISPLGIAIGRRAGLPVVLLENFTWDWIYTGYLRQAGEAGAERLDGLVTAIRCLGETFAMATAHIQTQPVCWPRPQADLVTPPISRPPRTPRAQMRAQLGLPEGRPVVLVTLGGIESYLALGDRLEQSGDLFFIVPGGSRTVRKLPNLLLLPHHSEYYHPDLLHASDAVVGKPGYSTLAEAYHAGIPFAYLPRPHFREYPVLVEFIERELGGLAIPEDSFLQGSWVEGVRGLLAAHSRQPRPDVGRALAAEFIEHFI